jgi:hypothetical protein
MPSAGSEAAAASAATLRVEDRARVILRRYLSRRY